MAELDEVWLSARVRVKHYREMEARKDRNGLAKFIHDRFLERYITPLKSIGKPDENGFLTMAVACLLIEALTAFREGWPSTEGLSERAVKLFFQREKAFASFKGRDRAFWKGVRCGILHQGETAWGWRLNFSRPHEPLFVAAPPTINCTKFLDGVTEAVNGYRRELENTPWNHELWRNFNRKMTATIEDCKPK